TRSSPRTALSRSRNSSTASCGTASRGTPSSWWRPSTSSKSRGRSTASWPGSRPPPSPAGRLRKSNWHQGSSCGYGCHRESEALVLAVEERLQLGFQFVLPASGFRGLERVHRRPVILPERRDEVRRRAREVERVGVSLERDVLGRHSCAGEPLVHLVLDAPGHGTDEPVGCRRQVGRADLEDLRDERRGVGGPGPITLPPPARGTRTI